MKNVKIALIVILSMVIVGLCVLLGLGISGRLQGTSTDGSGSWGNRYQIVQEQEFPADSINDILIEYTKSSNDVTLYEAEGDSIIVREYANYKPGGGELARMTSQGGKLTVRGPRRYQVFFHFNRYIYTEVYIPADYAGELKIATVSGEISVNMDLLLEGGLNLSSTSGDIYGSAQNLKAAEINVSSTSGGIRLPALGAGEVKISTTSGDISVKEAEAPVFCSSTSGEIMISGGTGDREISSTSGDVRVSSLSGSISVNTTSGETIISGGTGDREISSTSGDVRVDGLSGSVLVNTTSGEIRIRGERGSASLESTSGDILFSVGELSGDVSVNTASGEVTLELPETVSLNFEADTASGDISTFFDGDLNFSKKGNHAAGVVGSGERSVKISTTSGDVSVRKN